MQMNKATVLAILAFTTSALAQYEQYSYGSDIYAREAEPEFDDYPLYAREEEEEFSQLSAREEAYIAGYSAGLQARQSVTQKAALNNLASAENAKAATLDKQGDDAQHKAQHDAKIAELSKIATTADQSQIDALLAQLKTLESKMKVDKKSYEDRRHKAAAEAKKAVTLKGQANILKTDAKALTARELLEELYGFDFDY